MRTSLVSISPLSEENIDEGRAVCSYESRMTSISLGVHVVFDGIGAMVDC